MQKLTIVKIGGNIVDHEERLDHVISLFSSLEGNKILVHGGGKLATRVATALGLQTYMVDGRRVTDKDMLPITVMVYAGLINKQIVGKLQSVGCDAIGLSGADARVIQTVKRVNDKIDYGFVGDMMTESVCTKRLVELLKLGLVPVFSAITADNKGQLLNTNADTIASAIAIALAESYEVDLVYCFEHNGVLRDIDDADSVIKNITPEHFTALQEQQVIGEGMIPKIMNALEAVNRNVKSVSIKKAEDILEAGAGTIISK